ncbi:MAG TPA: MBL fold metallo-hydrolase [Chloroflexia bacterium]|nr:MBL fold metallo-hydrolase [Chloroflexia bacterium]
MDSELKERPTVPAWTLLIPALALALILALAGQVHDGRLHLWVFDVGQGDAIMLKTPRGHTALIDGGPGATPLLNSVGSHLPFWQHDLDLLVLTHPHQDHLMGFAELVERYQVERVVQTVFTATSGVQAEWLRELKRLGIPVSHPTRGQSITFEGEPELALHVLSPTTPDAHQEGASGDVNNTSVVLKLVYGEHSVLLEGDAQVEAERDMSLSLQTGLESDVLKVGHHGSDTSSSPQFLSLVKPKVAIISVAAANRYGHPSPQTLDNLQSTGARIYRTDQDGTVEIIADEEHLWVRSDR